MKIFSSKKRVAAIGVVTAASLVGGGMAYAYWTSTGNGSGSATTGTATPFVVTVGAPSGGSLAPGNGEQTFAVTVTNPSSAGVQQLNLVAAKVATSDLGPAWTVGVAPLTCTKDDFSVATVTGPALPVELGPSGTWTGSVKVTMINRTTVNQDGCKSLGNVPVFAKAS
jgi:hypothetical protein